MADLLLNNRKVHVLADNVVKYGLKPVLKKLGLPTKDAGLHAFRHGLATELAERSAPIPVLQQQMRHADVRTTLRVYAHAIPQSQRDAKEFQLEQTFQLEHQRRANLQKEIGGSVWESNPNLQLPTHGE